MQLGMSAFGPIADIELFTQSMRPLAAGVENGILEVQSRWPCRKVCRPDIERHENQVNYLVEQPAKFDLYINLSTANGIEFEIPFSSSSERTH